MYQYNYLFSLKNRYAIDILRIDVSTNTITHLTLYQKYGTDKIPQWIGYLFSLIHEIKMNCNRLNLLPYEPIKRIIVVSQPQNP